jgi:nitroreductase
MDVIHTIEQRRAYRSLVPVNIDKKTIHDLAESARLAPSCFNNQPWRYVFVTEKKRLQQMQSALSKGNEWAYQASMIIAVFSKEKDDCVIRERKYHQFDLGLSVGFMVLRATELGLVAHPIAGYSPKETRKILGIPNEYQIITLVIVGKHTQKINPVLSKKQKQAEKTRPPRKDLKEFIYFNQYRE